MKSKVTIQLMFAFGRGCGNPLSSADGASPYTQSSARLSALGHHRRDGETEKSHCKRLCCIMDAMAQGYFKKNIAKIPKPNKAAAKTTKNKPAKSAQQSVQVYIANKAVNPLDSGFLASFEWKATRMMAIKKYGPVCQCCGASPKTGAVINVDHIKPRKLFPHLALDLANLQVLCSDCNHGKGNWDQTDWR